MRSPVLLFALLSAALVACSSHGGTQLDGGGQPDVADEFADDVVVVVDRPDVLDATPDRIDVVDVADVPDAPTDRADPMDARDVVDVTDDVDAAPDRADVVDAGDAAPDVTDVVDVAIDAAPDRADAVPEASADVAPDVAADAGCGALTLCAGRCIDTATDVRNCGACGTSCPAPSNADATCVAGRCAFACVTGFHACAGVCVSSSAVATCGAACSPCATRAHATASCDGTACRYACDVGFADCDGDVTNGCERPVSADVANCGRCGNVCPGTDTDCRRRTCSAGVCGFADATAGTRTSAQMARDCRIAVCDGRGAIIPQNDDSDLPVDGNACTDDVCAMGVPSNPPTSAGSACGTMVCDGRGTCVECLRGSDCSTGVCTAGRCAGATCSDGVRNGSETGVDCGGSCPACPVLLVLGGGATGAYAASYDVSSGFWSPSLIAGARTVDGVALAVTTAGDGVGLLRHTELGAATDNRLRYTIWHAGSWSPFIDLGPTVTTQGPPAVTPAPSGAVWAVFHGFDFNHYFAAWNGTAWASVAEPVGASGGRAGAITRAGTVPLLVYSRGLPNELASRERGTTWGGDQLLEGAATFDYMVPPTAERLTDTLIMAAWVGPGGQVRAATRTGATWSAGANVPMCLARGRVALARVSDTRVVLAFHGTDDNLYATFWSAGTWATPVRVATAITGNPSVARGVGASSAELAWLDGTGRVMHARYAGAAWTTATPVGGTGLVSVAIASGP